MFNVGLRVNKTPTLLRLQRGGSAVKPIVTFRTTHTNQLRLLSTSTSSGGFERIIHSITESNVLFLQSLSEASGLPWWGVIATSAIVLRCCTTLPIVLYQQRSYGKAAALQPILKAWASIYQKGSAKPGHYDKISILMWQRGVSQQYKAKVKKLYRDHRYYPWLIFLLPVVQIPIFIFMSITLRSMAGQITYGWTTLERFFEPNFLTGGCAWFVDLVASDPTNILSLCIGAAHLANIEMFSSNTEVVNLRQKVFTGFARGMAMFMIIVASQAPAALSVYWLSSASFSLVQNLFLKVKPLRNLLKLPPIPEVK